MKLLMLGNNTKEEINTRLQIVASAGNLSRAENTVTQVFYSRNDYDANLKLARAVVGYGHKSIAEHDYLVFALEDVTPIVEQTLIGYRLTSFTIKSRRNVDFRNVGFYVPNFKDKEGKILENNSQLQHKYKEYMQSLFSKYGKLVDEAIPVEDCRYILPYSYYSNIIMGCDCNELLRITSDLLYGKNSQIDEMKQLGMHFKEMILQYAPYLSRALDAEAEKNYYKDHFKFLDDEFNGIKINDCLLKEPKLIDYAPNADKNVITSVVMNRYGVCKEDANQLLNKFKEKDKDIDKKIIKGLLQSKSQRELEQVCFSFEMPISLAVLTHITRHRMHSLLVPDFFPLWNFNNYITPDTIAKNNLSEYNDVFNKNYEMVKFFQNQGVRDEDLVYFYLSGNACNISTTMNARALEWISRMRCCKKAQWEIRNLMDKMVEQVCKVAPLIGSLLGPCCKVEGYCPEGKDSCMARPVVVKGVKKVLFATGNPAKVKRFEVELSKHGVEILTLKDVDVKLDVDENGKDAIENAIIKAKAYYNATNLVTIAMDDNLYFENVPEDKQPGVFVRRVNGKTLTDEEMIDYYSNLAKKYGKNGKITARWVYGMAVVKDGKINTYTWQKEDFYLVDTPIDKRDIGYPLNSISINKKLNKYFTDISKEEWLQLAEDESDVVNFIVNNVK